MLNTASSAFPMRHASFSLCSTISSSSHAEHALYNLMLLLSRRKIAHLVFDPHHPCSPRTMGGKKYVLLCHTLLVGVDCPSVVRVVTVTGAVGWWIIYLTKKKKKASQCFSARPIHPIPCLSPLSWLVKMKKCVNAFRAPVSFRVLIAMCRK